MIELSSCLKLTEISLSIYCYYYSNIHSDRESHITDLTNENAELRAKNTKLVDDLSVKEAKWLEKEQFFHRKVF